MLSRIAVTRTTRPTRHPGVVLVGVVASVALHALLLAPVLFGGGLHHHIPDARGTAANEDRPGADGALIVELISEVDGSSTASAQTPPIVSLLPSVSTSIPPNAADRVPPPELPDIETDRDARSSAAAPGDESLAAQLYGLYVHQISARIERAWMKPRMPIGAEVFSCQASILQDRAGQVREVTLNDCNGDERWKSSLVSAIRTASPLPAPPDPRVFTPRVVMEFRSLPFVEGGSPEGFEPAPLVARAEPSLPAPTAVPSSANELANRLHVLKAGQPIVSH
jgi:TonB C terminal